MATALFDPEPDSSARLGELLAKFQQDELRGVEEAVLRLDKAAAFSHVDYLLRLAQLKSAMIEPPAGGSEIAIYHVGTLFLKECFLYLTQGAPEFAHYVSGIRQGSVFTLDRMITFKYAKQSVAGVVGDPADTARALSLIDEFGHKLHAWFHSHPDMGAASYMPSAIDMKHQARLEEGGYPAIGAVFTRDGCIRFFSQQRAFSVNVYGKGVEKIDENLFRFQAGFVADQGR